MNKQDAYKSGVDSGIEAAEYGDFTPEELEDLDSFLTACAEICDNKRQYADHPGYDFNRHSNAENLWDAFEEGERVGCKKGWRMFHNSKTVKA